MCEAKRALTDQITCANCNSKFSKNDDYYQDVPHIGNLCIPCHKKWSSGQAVVIHTMHYTDLEMDMGCSMASMNEQLEEDYRAYTLICDADEDRKFGLEHISDIQENAEGEWPWYLEEQWEVQESDIIDGALWA